MKNKTKQIILLVLVSAVFVLTGLNSTRFFKRIDLTENKSFTISDVSKAIIQGIPGNVQITYYLSDKIRNITPVASEIEDLLYEYSAHSRGKVAVTVQDPLKTNTSKKAETMGVQPQQIEVYEKNEQSFAMVYSGITIQYLDQVETIPFIINLETLEYEITYKIRKLVENLNTKIGIIIGHNQKTLDNSFSFLRDKLSSVFELEAVQPGKEITSDYSGIIVLGGKDLTDSDLLYIDEYIMTGGKVLFCIDGVEVEMTRNLETTVLDEAPVFKMIENYGVKINNDIIIDKYARRIPLRGSFPMLYPQWISIAAENIAKDNPLTSGFSGLDLLWASSLELSNNSSSVKALKLLSSSDQAFALNENITANPYEVNGLASNENKERSTLDLGYVLSGKFKSFYTDKESPENRMIVIGDSDFASDVIRYSDSPFNIIFLENAVEWLAIDDSLLTIKTRDKREMRLNKIQVPEKKIKAILFVYLINIILVPAAVIAFGIIRFIRRKRKES